MFREDINCLRGFSIIIIILYHFYPKLFVGGFIGVDILFCISGYLIYNSLNRIKNDNYLTYYSNRIKRISPSQLTVMLIILLLYKNINPIDFSELCLECKNSLIFNLNNYYQWKNLDYLSQDKGKFNSPILHFWTLSIEFQFYIVAPFIVILLNNIRVFKYILLINILIYSIYYTKYNYVNSYFSSLIRLLDFSIGILSINNHIMYFSLIKILMFILIIILSFSQTFIKYYPGLVILIPLLFSSSFLSSQQYNNFLNIHIFSYVGRISYSLYLVHYPFIFNKNNKILNLLFSFIVSIVLFVVIEKKSRNMKFNNVITICSYILFVILFYSLINRYEKFKLKSTKKIIFTSVWKYNSLFLRGCILTDRQFNLNYIKSYILLLGDSHMQHWFPAINYYIKNNNITAISILFWGDRIINNDYIILQSVFKLIKSPLLMLLSFRLSKFKYIPNITLFNNKFVEFIKFLKMYCNTLLLLDETPIHNYNPFKLYFSNKESHCIININCSVTNYENIKEMNITVIPIRSLFCSKRICKDVIDNTLVYSDQNHITLQFSLKNKQYFYRLLEKYLHNNKSEYLFSQCVISQQSWYNKFIKDFYSKYKIKF